MIAVRLALALLPLALVACVGEGEDPPRTPGPPRALDCAWARGDNCFKSVVAAAAACLPPLDAVGALSEDGRTCTFATGQTVTFDDPVRLPFPDGSRAWNFTVRANGRECLRVTEPDIRHWSVASPAGAVDFVATSASDATAICPDGSRFFAADWSELQLSCAQDGPLGETPGADSSIYDDHSVTYRLTGTGGPGDPATSLNPGATHIFRCAR